MPDHIYIFIDSTFIKDNKAQSALTNASKSLIKYKKIYKLSYKTALTHNQLDKIKKLLGCKILLEKTHISKNSIVIGSRSSYKSPWSEKAKQIISNCGFSVSLKIDQFTNIVTNVCLMKKYCL